jgi:hypothetical protein
VRRDQFEHVIAAAAAASGETEIVVVGSQAILGSYAEPPDELLDSMEADVYPRRNPERADEIDGAIGDGSQFHITYGYYAHGVGPETAKAPAGWQDRLVQVEIAPRAGSQTGTTALCLELHDLVLAKAAAGRERDWDYVEQVLEAGLADHEALLKRVPDMPVDDKAQERVVKMLTGIMARLGFHDAAD